MFATAERYKIKNKIIVFTGVDVSRELKKACEGTGTRIIRRSRLENSLIKWNKDSRRVKSHEPHTLMEHQQDALQACMDGFRQHDRGKCIMACGTGKTLTALHIAEKTGRSGRSGTVSGAVHIACKTDPAGMVCQPQRGPTTT